MRVLKIAGAAAAAVLVVLMLILMVGVPSGFITSAIRQRVERDTGLRLTVDGATTVRLWPALNVTLEGLALAGPGDRDTDIRLTIARAQAAMSLSGIWSGHPDISELIVTRPVLHVPLLRRRIANADSAQKPAAAPALPRVTRITITDGTVEFADPAGRLERRIEGIDAEAVANADRKIRFTGSARAAGTPLTFDIAAAAPAPPFGHRSVPFELALDAPGLLQGKLEARGEARLNGALVMVNAVSGALGEAAFNGWASADLRGKPQVKLDLDFRKLAIAMPKAGGSPSQPWSDTPVDLAWLNYVNAEVNLSAGELKFGDAQFSEARAKTRLEDGMMRTAVTQLSAYGGRIVGFVDADVTAEAPQFAVHSDLTEVRALPLLDNLAGFDRLDGRLQATLDLRARGASPRQIMSSLDGTASVLFQDGAIRGINVAKMIRALAGGTLSGWQASRDESTDLSRLSASFRLDKGRAATGDLDLVGPLVRMTGAGTVDLGARTLSFRVEPKLVMTTEGQGRTTEPVGLGIPVAVEGAWAEPRIYPDIAGILDNPEAAYAKLREMGKGLFGAGNGVGDLLNGLGLGGGSGDDGGKSGSSPLGEAIGSLIEQGLQAGSKRNAPVPAPTPSPQSEAPDRQPLNEMLQKLFSR
jgi:AsmA protein